MEEKYNITQRLFILLNLLDESTIFYAGEIAAILGISDEEAKDEIEFFNHYLVKVTDDESGGRHYNAIRLG